MDRFQQTGRANEGIGPAVGWRAHGSVLFSLEQHLLKSFQFAKETRAGIWERNSVASGLCTGDPGKQEYYGKLRTCDVFRDTDLKSIGFELG